MKVKLMCGRGLQYGHVQDPGQIIEVSDEEGRALIAAGSAEHVETAIREPTHHAAKRVGKPQGRTR